MKKTLRLILGDQLNYQHHWFTKADSNVLYFMAEMKQETEYVKHHIQKVVAFFMAMRHFKNWLKNQGHEVIYYEIDHPENLQTLPSIIQELVRSHEIEVFEYQLPDEYRLDEQLKKISEALPVKTSYVDTEHFYTAREELAEFFKGKKQLLMESFYRMMRKKHAVLMLGDVPVGERWNFDQSNRKKWKGTPQIPESVTFKREPASIINQLQKAGVTTFGNIDEEEFWWPVNRQESLDLLHYFCEHLLMYFGDYQDAMHTHEKFLFHSRLSFALNTKILSPKEVIDTTVLYYQEHKDRIHISQIEGFVRQILGWREYVRGIYWKEMPTYETLNKLDNHNALPNFYWNGDTQMNCLQKSISQSLDDAYAHHIQRLMITGNFALLAQIHPDEVDAWYLGVYADAIQWVEITNTRGMSQYADGGLLATKPYVSSGSYINKMSNYCQSCTYKVKEKTGENSCPFNSLYWNFLDEKRQLLSNNPRMRMMYSVLDKMDIETVRQIKKRAQDIIQNPDRF